MPIKIHAPDTPTFREIERILKYRFRLIIHERHPRKLVLVTDTLPEPVVRELIKRKAVIVVTSTIR